MSAKGRRRRRRKKLNMRCERLPTPKGNLTELQKSWKTKARIEDVLLSWKVKEEEPPTAI